MMSAPAAAAAAAATYETLCTDCDMRLLIAHNSL